MWRGVAVGGSQGLASSTHFSSRLHLSLFLPVLSVYVLLAAGGRVVQGRQGVRQAPGCQRRLPQLDQAQAQASDPVTSDG